MFSQSYIHVCLIFPKFDPWIVRHVGSIFWEVITTLHYRDPSHFGFPIRGIIFIPFFKVQFLFFSGPDSTCRSSAVVTDADRLDMRYLTDNIQFFPV